MHNDSRLSLFETEHLVNYIIIIFSEFTISFSKTLRYSISEKTFVSQSHLVPGVNNRKMPHVLGFLQQSLGHIHMHPDTLEKSVRQRENVILILIVQERSELCICSYVHSAYGSLYSQR